MESIARSRANLLLVEDDAGDQELTRRALDEGVIPTDLHVVWDGVEALDYLHGCGAYGGAPRSLPDLVLLDLNLPRVDGRHVLREMQGDPALWHIPVVVLTMSNQASDVNQCYELGCNSYITKPVELLEFVEVVRRIRRYWFELVVLPTRASAAEAHGLERLRTAKTEMPAEGCRAFENERGKLGQAEEAEHGAKASEDHAG